MNFKINRKKLIESLERVTRIIDHKSYVASLHGLVIQVNVDNICLIASNENVSIKDTIETDQYDLNIKEVGNILIKGKFVLDILKKMDDEIIKISNFEKNTVFITGKNNEFSLNILDYEDYPLIGFNRKGTEIIVNATDLRKAINKTIISVSEYNQKIVLRGINLKLEQNKLYLFGTDNYRVSRNIIELNENSNSSLQANIPFKSANEVVKLLADLDEIKIIFNEGTVSFVTKTAIFQTTLLEGKFPNVNAAFPKDFDTTIFAKTKDILHVIHRADIPNDEGKITVVNFIIDEKNITIKSSIKEIGNFSENFTDFELRGLDQQNISFNSKFLLDAIRVFETNQIEINLTDFRRPIVISSIEDPNLHQIVLPLSTN
ncbi:DNA polymerase III subunit beta [Spiroplasma sp. TIUS-1]|uniref:DNA polymerase III subunit beta n=1 Tax=Spiroplasma sp. TIUS-1 TaxID=216963 RepID=UPI0013982164|nr:DNA polymerase III subunit beta [Spiroplasma sp. TIUS-1]QHX35557.1 DNA polymerase III subunit beta [Spiroplasma sp. TIUS-1]